MDLIVRNKYIEDMHDAEMRILQTKGADYTGGKASIDGNANFHDIARRLEGAPMDALTVAMIYLEKQVMALETFIRTRRLESESILQRHYDVSNYSNILATIMHDMKLIDLEAELGLIEEAPVDLSWTPPSILVSEGPNVKTIIGGGGSGGSSPAGSGGAVCGAPDQGTCDHDYVHDVHIHDEKEKWPR